MNSLLARARTKALCVLRGIDCDWSSILQIANWSSVDFAAPVTLRKACIYVARDASLKLGSDARLEGKLTLGSGSSFSAGSGFRLLGGELVVLAGGKMEVGDNCLIERTPFAHAAVRIETGSLHAGTNVSFRGLLRIDAGGEMAVGSHVFLNHGSEVRCHLRVDLGDFVYLSYWSDIFDTNTHPLNHEERRQEVTRARANETMTDYALVDKAPVRIGSDVWIGKNATILKGVTLGDRAVVGARSVVTRSWPDDVVLVGNPAQPVERRPA
jgi:acetyltransferase-like isoleucine patch superfamily enzyme